MRLSQRATTNISVLALAASIVAVVLWAWAFALEPERLKVETAKIEAQTEQTLALAELAAKLGSIVEYLDHEDQLEALRRVTNESNRKMRELRNAPK